MSYTPTIDPRLVQGNPLSLPSPVSQMLQLAHDSQPLPDTNPGSLAPDPDARAREFVQDLASQTQLLACLQWLCDFQVLPCIPPTQTVAHEGLADLVGVPVTQLSRVVRMTATAGFLCEPRPAHTAHSPLSAQFVNKPSLFDALMFVSGTAAPTALRMAEATRRLGNPLKAHPSAYSIATNSSKSFAAACEQDAGLQNKLAAFQRLEASGVADSVTDILSSLDWTGLGEATVVEVGARSTATALALSKHAPNLHFVVQMRDDAGHENGKSSRSATPLQADTPKGITVQRRIPGTAQRVQNAAVYILHLPWPSPSASSSSLLALCASELRVHSNLLRANRKATLILIARLLPEPGATDTKVEAVARLNDLLLLQMGNDQALEMSRLSGLLEGVRDDTSQLVIANRLSSARHPIVAFELQVLDNSGMAFNEGSS